jgi:hypothetical protein
VEVFATVARLEGAFDYLENTNSHIQIILIHRPRARAHSPLTEAPRGVAEAGGACGASVLDMKLEKLFNVLVLGGAALGVAACGSDGDDDQEADEQAASDDADEQQTPDDGDDAADGQQTDEGDDEGQAPFDGGSGGPTDGTDEDEDGEETAVDASAPVVEDAGTTLTCSESASPSDPCGCPCCWSGGLNTDDSCTSFCAAGNDGKGCCDV